MSNRNGNEDGPPCFHRAGPPPPGNVYSVFGDSPGVGAQLGPAHLNFEAPPETLRSIRNRIVVLSKGEVIWIARVPPDQLSHAPSRGRWQLVPATVSDITSFLEPSLAHPAQTKSVAGAG